MSSAEITLIKSPQALISAIQRHNSTKCQDQHILIPLWTTAEIVLCRHVKLLVRSQTFWSLPQVSFDLPLMAWLQQPSFLFSPPRFGNIARLGLQYLCFWRWFLFEPIDYYGPYDGDVFLQKPMRSVNRPSGPLNDGIFLMRRYQWEVKLLSFF